jgi:hypothetical protein
MDRTLRAKVNNCYSEWSQPGEVNCGVPQGSILGSLLFWLYINDLSQAVHNWTLHLYTDDSSLFFPIHLNDNVYLAHRLIQDDLYRMEQWSENWKLNIKAAKTKEVLFGPPGKASRIHPNLFLNKEPIPQGNSHKHHGVILDSKLYFQTHIE